MQTIIVNLWFMAAWLSRVCHYMIMLEKLLCAKTRISDKNTNTTVRKKMSSLEKKYLAYLSASTKESREYDDDFRELEHAYCAELLEKERLELMAIFGDTDECDADEDEIPADHR